MSPETHLLASWIIAAKTTDNPRDCRLVTLAGILPDADGLGLLLDAASRAVGHQPTFFYQNYHHYLLHGGFGGLLIVATMTLFARRHWRVALLALLVFHLHLLCDFVGSRGPSPADLWPIFYYGPFDKDPMWVWKGQWRLDGWQNRVISLALFGWALWLPIRRGDSVVGVFNRRADQTFVAVLRKWHAALTGPQSPLRYLSRPPWRTAVPGLLLLSGLFGGYALWQPGLDIRDGQHDRLRNGIWLGHGWLAGTEWFVKNGKTNELSRYRDPARMRELASLLKQHHIRDLFPHLCPSDPHGNLPLVDDAQVERFLSEFPGFRVMPWIGGPNGPNVRYRDPRWRVSFLANIRTLFALHPTFAGVHLNVEPLTSGDMEFLKFLDELHATLPKGKLLSIAAYPPPTRWHPHPDAHWEEGYFRKVASRCDQVVVMMYDTALRRPKLYQWLMSRWTGEVLAWSGPTPVLLGIPTYTDAGVDYHDPQVENLTNALRGIHRGLSDGTPPPNYQGVALYCEWETDAAEWDYLSDHFLRK